jgi:hypothetical protein
VCSKEIKGSPRAYVDNDISYMAIMHARRLCLFRHYTYEEFLASQGVANCHLIQTGCPFENDSDVAVVTDFSLDAGFFYNQLQR